MNGLQYPKFTSAQKLVDKFILEFTSNDYNKKKIREQLYRRFVGHSMRYYNVETYETILENLIKCYEEHNQDTRWRDID